MIRDKFDLAVLVISLMFIAVSTCNGQFDGQAPTDSGTFYLRVFELTGEDFTFEKTERCQQTHLAYYFPKGGKFGFQDEEGYLDLSPVEGRPSMGVDENGHKWTVLFLIDEDGNTNQVYRKLDETGSYYMDGYHYQISNKDICGGSL